MEEAGKLCFYCASLHFADTVFLRLKTCGSSMLRKSIVKTFSTVCFLALCYILVILTMFQFLIVISIVVMVTCDH